MATIRSMLELQDRMSAPMNRILNVINQTVNAMNNLSATDNFDTSAISNMEKEINSARSEFEQLAEDMRNSESFQIPNINQTQNKVIGLTSSVKKLVSAYATVQTVSKLVNISDDISQTKTRLDLMNDGLQTTDELFNMIYQSAQNARGSITGMADVVARFGNNARDAFGSSAEVVQFAELVQKQMTIAGASTTESSNAMLQLSQALGSGVLRGDELNSIFEQAPNLIQSIADYLQVPIGAIREMASEGQLTADIVKNAIFASADDINAKFNEMPMTWSQIWQRIKNDTIMSFQPVLNKINELANSESMQTFLGDFTNILNRASTVVTEFISVIAAIGSFFVSNWSFIEPIILGIVTAMGLYNAVLLINNTYQAISNGLKALATIKSAMSTTAITAEMAATVGMTQAQLAFNTALLACPITWIIVAIISIIAIIYIVVAAINKATDSTISATGIIFGSVCWLVAVIWNSLIGLLDAIVQALFTLVEPFSTFIEWLLNVFNGGFDSIGGAFANLAGRIISCLLSIAKIATPIIDALFGTNWTDKLTNLQTTVKSWGATDRTQTASFEAPSLNKYRWSYSDAWDTGYTAGSNLETNVSNMLDTNLDLSLFDTLNNTTSDIADNTKSISDSLDCTEEDLKYLRDIAERDIVNRFTTAEVKIDFGGITNNVASTFDLDGIVDYIAEKTAEELEIVAEGVYA